MEPLVLISRCRANPSRTHEAECLADATVLPPARQGDIYRAVRHYAPSSLSD